MERAELLPAAGRLMLAAALALTLMVFGGEALVQLLLPLLREVIALFAPDFVVENLRVTSLNSDRVLRLDIVNRYHLYLGGKLLPPGRSINTSINVMAPLVPIAAGLATALAWPGPWRQLPRRLPFLALLLVPVLLVDAPLVLVALAWDFWHYNLNPSDISPWSLWMQFLTRGGRPALGILCGCAAVLLAGRRTSTCPARSPGSAVP